LIFNRDVVMHLWAEEGVQELCRPWRDSLFFPLYPGLPPWAKSNSPLRGSISRNRSTVPTQEEFSHKYFRATAWRENICRPYGTRVYFPLYPALRLRLRAGLNYAAPMALDFRPSSPLANTKFGFHTRFEAPSK